MTRTTGQRLTRQALREYFPDGKWAGRVQPLPEQGVVFVKNATAATSTVLLWLHRIHTGDPTWVPVRSIRAEHKVPQPKQVGLATTFRMLDGEAFRFTFVRDPARRVVSAYRDKIVGSIGDRWRADIRSALGRDDDATPTFEQFVSALEAQEPIRMDPHWRPQYLNLIHPLVTYDLVGRLETFDADLARLREATGLPDVPIEVRHASPSWTESPLDGRPDLRRRIEAIYARDFELYAY